MSSREVHCVGFAALLVCCSSVRTGDSPHGLYYLRMSARIARAFSVLAMARPWRTLPRKPAGDRLSTQIVARATASERAEIYALAAAAGLPVSRYIVLSALGRRPK